MFNAHEEHQAEKEWRSLIAKKGSELGQSKLNEKLVKRIRERHAFKMAEVDRLNREHSAEAMAREFQVHISTIEKVLLRKSWNHVKDM